MSLKIYDTKNKVIEKLKNKFFKKEFSFLYLVIFSTTWFMMVNSIENNSSFIIYVLIAGFFIVGVIVDAMIRES